MNNSIFKYDATLPKHNKLEGSEKTDVLIIGGGIVGLLCAHFLQQVNIL